MKKIFLISALFVTLLSCTKEQEKDCNCNRVVQVTTINVVAGNGGVGVTKLYKYTTINDCTGIQRESSFSSQSVSVGECK